MGNDYQGEVDIIINNKERRLVFSNKALRMLERMVGLSTAEITNPKFVIKKVVGFEFVVPAYYCGLFHHKDTMGQPEFTEDDVEESFPSYQLEEKAMIALKSIMLSMGGPGKRSQILEKFKKVEAALKNELGGAENPQEPTGNAE